MTQNTNRKPNPWRWDIDRLVLVGIVLLIPVGVGIVVVGWIITGDEDDRYFPGGLTLACAAMAGLGAYVQIRTGKAIVRESWRSNRLKWVDKKDSPVRYWFTTAMYTICAISFLVYAIIFLIFTAAAFD